MLQIYRAFGGSNCDGIRIVVLANGVLFFYDPGGVARSQLRYLRTIYIHCCFRSIFKMILNIFKGFSNISIVANNLGKFCICVDLKKKI